MGSAILPSEKASPRKREQPLPVLGAVGPGQCRGTGALSHQLVPGSCDEQDYRDWVIKQETDQRNPRGKGGN